MATKERIKTRKGKTSEQAKAVALDVIAKVVKGGRINKQEIMRKHGYSEASIHSGKAISTDTYKETIQNTLERMEKERTRLLIELSNRDISTERYSTIVDAMDKLTKNSQLLGGKATENVATLVTVVRYDDTTDQAAPPSSPS